MVGVPKAFAGDAVQPPIAQQKFSLLAAAALELRVGSARIHRAIGADAFVAMEDMLA